MSFYKSKISKYKPIKKLTKGFKEFGGRNNTGRITVAHKGGGHKRLYREIDFKRNNKSGIVINTEYDPNRSANIAKILDDSKAIPSFYYIIAPKDLQPLDKLYSNNKPLNEINIGDTYPLHYFNVGDLVHNIELNPGQGGKLVRSAGTYAQVLQKPSIHSKYARLRLPSGEERLILAQCKATLGAVSNSKHRLRNIRKAGVSRWLNKRPTVRGVAMNPVDHPHGGGEGKTSGGRPSVTPWAKPTKGQPTRNKKKSNTLILLKRKKKQ